MGLRCSSCESCVCGHEEQSLAENTGPSQTGQTSVLPAPLHVPHGCYTSCVRQLIVNADDLGLTVGVNRAIRETHTDGIVTSATLMASGAAFDDAIELAESAPRLSVGCHVVLVDGAPVSEHGSIPTLLANRSSQPGRFYSRISAVAVRAVFGRLDPDELVSEIVAQVRKIQAAGVQVTHLDTHKHTHIFPQILRALVKAARICGVPAIRNPFVPATSLRSRKFSRRPRLWKRYSQVRMLRNSFAAQFHDKMKHAGLATPDGVVGVIETGSLDRSLLRQALADLPEGTWELVCHPGYDDADLRSSHTRLLESRDQERQLLISAELRQFLDKQGIRLISFREFKGK
jgi:chitin disaccharide deacetylase